MNLRFFKNPTLQFTDARGIKKILNMGKKSILKKMLPPGYQEVPLKKFSQFGSSVLPAIGITFKSIYI